MENNMESIRERIWLRYVPFCLMVFALIGLVADGYYTYQSSQTRDQQVYEAQTQLEKERLAKATCLAIKDSLLRLNADLSKYKTLTMAMVHRDEVTGQLKHKVGDIVRIKNDSAKVVIEDVLIGGGKYNYYVKFKVLFKDQTTKEVTPELIY